MLSGVTILIWLYSLGLLFGLMIHSIWYFWLTSPRIQQIPEWKKHLIRWGAVFIISVTLAILFLMLGLKAQAEAFAQGRLDSIFSWIGVHKIGRPGKAESYGCLFFTCVIFAIISVLMIVVDWKEKRNLSNHKKNGGIHE